MNDLEDRLRHMYTRVAESADTAFEADTTIVALRAFGHQAARPAWRIAVAAAAALALLVGGGWLLRQRVADNDAASTSDTDRIYGIPMWVPEGYAYQGASIDVDGVATLEWRRGPDSLLVRSGRKDDVGIAGAMATMTMTDAMVAVFAPLPVDDSLLGMLWMVDAATFRAVTAKAGFVKDEWQRWDVPGDPIDGSDLTITGGLQTGMRLSVDLGLGWSARQGCRSQQIGNGYELLLMSDKWPVDFKVRLYDGSVRVITGESPPGLFGAFATVVASNFRSVVCREPG
jgi:hypothetical protein